MKRYLFEPNPSGREILRTNVGWLVVPALRFCRFKQKGHAANRRTGTSRTDQREMFRQLVIIMNDMDTKTAVRC